MKKTCIIICGPTASGKTALAIALAQHFHTAVISADSRQCYREMNIGVARPTPEELAAVPHYFIASHSIHETVNAAVFENYALEKVNERFRENDVVVMAGGTGLYIQAFCRGMDEIPPVPAAIAEQLEKDYADKGMTWLQQEVEKNDPEYFATGEIQNPHRLLRALGVKLGTGNSIRHYQQGRKAERGFRIIKAGIELPRPELYARINERVNRMMEAGFLAEAERLFPHRHLKPLQTVGYAELFAFLEGKITLPEAVEQIQQHTRNYAKRQLTWFRKDEEITWQAAWTAEKLAALVK